MKVARMALLAGTALALAAGCGSSHQANGPMDAAITFDATPPPDTGPDSGYDAGALPAAGDVGSMCTMGSDCTGSYCLDEVNTGFPGGYCSAICGSGAAMCPDGSTCVPINGMTSLCLDDCDPSAPGRQCRHGYGCASDPMAFPSPVCYPGCTDDTDCPTGDMCDTSGGQGGACYNPSSSIGDACMDSTSCPDNAFCFAEQFSGWPGGACVDFGCTPADNNGCGPDSVCEPAGFGGHGICIKSCTTDSDCRANYACKTDPTYPDRKYCGPACTMDSQCSSGAVCNPALGTCDAPFNPSDIGTACTRRSCSGGTCLNESTSGFPGNYCTYIGCDPTAADGTDGCPGTGVCFQMGSTDLCLQPCTTDTDCTRDGYVCRHRDPTDTSSPMACVPDCTTNAQCTSTGDLCNPGVGLCTAPFVDANLGQACMSDADCAGGHCYTEASDGWPGGTCAAIGCRLSGTGPAETCPSGGVCVDDGSGSDIGICLTACDPSTSGTCRMGYACVALPSDSTMGACKPMCTADTDCSGGRTCDTTTGLCH